MGSNRAARRVYPFASFAYLGFYLSAFAASGIPFALALRGALANALPDVLLGVLLLRVPSRLRAPEGDRRRFIAAHAVVLAAFVLASTVGWLALFALDHRIFEGGWVPRVEPRFVLWRVLNDLLIYSALMGLGYAAQGAAERRDLAARAARAEALRARAELEALRSQLQPHFILNTFHALIGLVRRDPALAEEALEKLGELLRYALRIQREGRDEVSLGEEWAFVSTYLDLERLRLGERLRVSFTAEDGVLASHLPSLALQTLVENAVRHAVAPRVEGGRIDSQRASGRRAAAHRGRRRRAAPPGGGARRGARGRPAVAWRAAGGALRRPGAAGARGRPHGDARAPRGAARR